jgi:hypothetical protein
MIALLCLLTAPAGAVDNEINVEAGWIGAPDPSWALFSERASLGTLGVRGGYALNDRIAVIAGWQHGSDGITVSSGGYEEAYYYGYEDYGYYYGNGEPAYTTEVHTAFIGEQITVGAKADLAPLTWLHPYVAVQGAALVATAKFDDDTSTDRNVTQLKRTGVTGGVVATAGLDFPIKVVDGLAVAPYIEGGYAWYAPATLQDIGQIGFHGFTGRAGVGLRF